MAGPRSGSAAQPPPALIVDLNLPPALVDRLTERGLQAVHWSQLGPLTARDEMILARAKADGLVLVTHDLDFSAILAATGEDSPSVIQIRLQDLASNSVALVVEDLLAEHAVSLRDGALVSVSESGARVRMLPLRRR